MNAYRHIIASFLFVIFSCIQLADLHVLDHDANDTDCDICLIASQNHLDTFIPSETTIVPDTIFISVDVVISYRINPFINSDYYNTLRNKAPPIA